MKLTRKIWIPLAVLVVMIAAVVLVALKHNADDNSRAQAKTAAAVYEKAAHAYLTAAASDLNAIGSPQANAAQAAAGLAQLEKLQKSVPQLARVGGTGAQLPAYQAAATYQAQVQKVSAAIDASNKADDTYLPYEQAYAAMLAVQNDISAGKLSAGDPAAAVTATIITPLTQAQAAFAKAAVPAAYAAMAKDITATLSDYLTAGKTLAAMYQSGNLHSVNFNFVPQLNAVYSEIEAAAAPLNTQALQAATQAQALAQQLP